MFCEYFSIYCAANHGIWCSVHGYKNSDARGDVHNTQESSTR